MRWIHLLGQASLNPAFSKDFLLVAKEVKGLEYDDDLVRNLFLLAARSYVRMSERVFLRGGGLG